MKKPTKPNYHFFRPANFLADTHGMSNAAVGALLRLAAHAWQRWKPEAQPFPSLPNDEDLLARLCGNARSWKKVRAQVLAKLTLQDGQLFYAPQREDAENVRNFQTLKAEKKAQKEAEKAENKPAPKPKKEKPQAPAATVKQEPPAAPPAPAPEPVARPWHEQPAAVAGRLVYGLQGFHAVGWPEMTKLLRHPTRLKEGDCTMWNVLDADVKQHKVKVQRNGARGFTVTLPSGQVLMDN
jgi:outer membrane biosynthesis protein TonB